MCLMALPAMSASSSACFSATSALMLAARKSASALANCCLASCWARRASMRASCRSTVWRAIQAAQGRATQETPVDTHSPGAGLGSIDPKHPQEEEVQ